MLSFIKLNRGWNAEPNAPTPILKRSGADVLLEFFLNPFQFPAFAEEERGVLRFTSVIKFRLGPTNDEGWYLGQCRYSKLAPGWGEFYEVVGPDPLIEEPRDWQALAPPSAATRHFLFYFRDETFEALAEGWQFESIPENALLRLPTLDRSPNAEGEIEETFSLSGRGLVVTLKEGWRGVIPPGGVIENGLGLEAYSGPEFLDSISEGRTRIALVVHPTAKEKFLPGDLVKLYSRA